MFVDTTLQSYIYVVPLVDASYNFVYQSMSHSFPVTYSGYVSVQKYHAGFGFSLFITSGLGQFTILFYNLLVKANLRVRKCHVVIEANLQCLQLSDSDMVVVANSKLCMALIMMSG